MLIGEPLLISAASFVPPLSNALPETAHILRRTAIVVAAFEGAISHAVYGSPEWLAEPWFLDELVSLGVE